MNLLFRSLLILAMAVTAGAAELPELVQNLEADNYDVRYQARQELQTLMENASPPAGDPVQRAELETQLVTGLDSVTDLTAKLWVIRMLEWFGSADCVNALAARLWDDNPSVRDAARRALAANPAPAAARALRQALASTTTADQPAAYIEALAYHGDPRSWRVIAPYLQSDDPQVVNSAARALGKLNQRGAYRFLVAARNRGPATIRPATEVAMLDLGLSRSDARALLTDGSTAAIRVAAFRQLANRDTQRALQTLKQIVASGDNDPAAPAIIRAAMETTDPVPGNYLVTNLATISPAGQQVILAAVMDDGRAAYERPLLAFLPAATGAVRDSTIRALGLIGGEATFEALFALFLQDPNDTLTDTLAGLRVAAVDARLFKMLSNGADEAKQIAAIRMLAIRRPAGTLDTFHKLAAPGASEPIREAVFKELETAGNPASCQLLAAIVVQPDPLKRLAQQTLKRLSLNLGNADALWESAYQPALETAPNDAAREDLLAIVDGVAGTKSLAYLERPALDPAHPLHAAAVRSLSRWPDFAAGEVWLKLLATENLAADDLPAAEKGIIRIITQESITAPPRDKYDLAVRAIQAGPTAAIKEAILDRCESPAPQPQKTEFETAFSALLDDPDIGLQVYPLLGQTPPPPEPEPEPASPPAAE